MNRAVFQQREFRATPSAQLRELLGQLEAHVGTLEHDSGEEVRKIPALFDAADAIIAELEPAGAPLPAEMARLETVSASFRRKAKTFLRKVGGIDAFAALRGEHNPETAQWWWFIDQWVADQSKTQRRRQLKSLLIGAAVLTVLAGVYVLFLQPDAATLERIRRQEAAEQFAQNGDNAAALGELNEALTIAPDDASLLAFKGVLQTRLGLEAEAATTFTAAEVAAENREHFFLIRAQVYLTLNMFEAMLADAEAAVAVNPQSARGYLYLAQANASLGNFGEAQKQYDEAWRLADEAGDGELAALARVQKAYLYQQMLTLPMATTTAP
jgi:tetratricopeptide (TPR) repeat protein